MPRDEFQEFVSDQIFKVLREQPLGLNVKLIEHHIRHYLLSNPVEGLNLDVLYHRIFRTLKHLISTGHIRRDGVLYIVVEHDLNSGMKEMIKELKDKMPQAFSNRDALLAAFNSAVDATDTNDQIIRKLPKIGSALSEFEQD